MTVVTPNGIARDGRLITLSAEAQAEEYEYQVAQANTGCAACPALLSPTNIAWLEVPVEGEARTEVYMVHQACPEPVTPL